MKIYYFRFEMSMKVVPEGPIYNIPALIRKMAWRQSGDRPLSELMMVSLLMHVWITWPQWVNKIEWNTCDSPGRFMIFNRNKLLDWTHWGLGEVAVILRKQFQNFFVHCYKEDFPEKLLSFKCHWSISRIYHVTTLCLWVILIVCILCSAAIENFHPTPKAHYNKREMIKLALLRIT